MAELSDYDYVLPEERIAQFPAKPRDACKLLVLGKNVTHTTFTHLVEYLEKGDVLVLNHTKVVKAKLTGKKTTGSPAEIILLNRLATNTYTCRIKTRNPVVGTKFLLGKGAAEVVAQAGDMFTVRFSTPSLMQEASLPNPPYIKHTVTDNDYQTVFSKKKGSVAAPTAGLHFTKRLLEKIRKKGIVLCFLTLHVGYGTFLPVRNLSENVMEEEQYAIPQSVAAAINNRKGRLFVVGTTTLKALESSSRNGTIIPGSGASQLFIKPGHAFQSGADALLTNFHLPKSTLILLTCAFAGRERVLAAYEEAIDKKYRFYSLGDAMLIFRESA
ncbi:MAG: tRNA preQ1(34) S-adenosylmethionine ribosyltransferase-isomerase QueA [archaeon]